MLCCYWFCDWVQFGLKSDLINIWDVPNPTSKAINGTDTTLENLYFAKFLGFNEIYVWNSFLRKNVAFRYQHVKECSEFAISNTEQSFVNNLVLLELEQFGVESVKYFNRKNYWKENNVLLWVMCYSHSEWLKLYEQYCDPLIDIPDDYEFSLKMKALKDYFIFINQNGLPTSREYVDELRQLGVQEAMLPYDTNIMGEYVRIINRSRVKRPN